MRWLDRYREGDVTGVWKEIAAEGESLRASDELLVDARAVATEMMSRVRSNVIRLQKRWGKAGWLFGYEWCDEWGSSIVAAAPPELGEPAAKDALDAIETRCGPMPISLRAFFDVVGAVNFVGEPEDEDWDDWMDRERIDPLQIQAAPDAADLERSDDGTYDLYLFPDPLVKYFISGVGSLYTRLPSGGADALFEFEGAPFSWHGAPLTLVSYLRYTILENGGFGLVDTDELPRKKLARFVKDLVPF